MSIKVTEIPKHASAGVDPKGGCHGRTPKLHKEGKNVVCVHTKTSRFST